VLEESPAKLYLENTHEHSPWPINTLIDLLVTQYPPQPAENPPHTPDHQQTKEIAQPDPREIPLDPASTYARVGLCLDIGHWFHYAMGRHWDNLTDWLEISGPRIRHLHLHDNNGQADQHLGLGQASLNLPVIWEQLQTINPPPTITLENHLLESLKQSLVYLKYHPLYQSTTRTKA
jgi:hypothetical protein